MLCLSEDAGRAVGILIGLDAGFNGDGPIRGVEVVDEAGEDEWGDEGRRDEGMELGILGGYCSTIAMSTGK